MRVGFFGASPSAVAGSAGPPAVTAVELDAEVAAAAAATTPPPESVRVIIDDAVAFARGAADGAFGAIVVDVFDERSRLPEAAATSAFAEDLARVAGRGLACNLVRETALHEPDAACEAFASFLCDAVERRGGAVFLAGDRATENAVLFAWTRRGGAPRDAPGALKRAAANGRAATERQSKLGEPKSVRADSRGAGPRTSPPRRHRRSEPERTGFVQARRARPSTSRRSSGAASASRRRTWWTRCALSTPGDGRCARLRFFRRGFFL